MTADFPKLCVDNDTLRFLNTRPNMAYQLCWGTHCCVRTNNLGGSSFMARVMTRAPTMRQFKLSEKSLNKRFVRVNGMAHFGLILKAIVDACDSSK